MKTFKTSTGENIYVYDDVFSWEDAYKFEQIAQTSSFKLNTTTAGAASDTSSFYRCFLNEHELDKFNIFNTDGAKSLEHHFKDQIWYVSWILSSTYMTKYQFHIDNTKKTNGKSFLYYINTKWDKDWGGETLFANSNGEVEIAVSFKPNRVVIFDSEIVHKPSMITADATPYRYTFVAQFKHYTQE